MDGANIYLSTILERLGDDAMSQLPDAVYQTTNLVRDVVNQAYAKGDLVNIKVVAKKLGMSTRLVQKRLADEGSSFKAIHNDMRKQVALSWLHQPQVNITEVAYLLGFSETSAFCRAFKRWTGNTPLAYRQERR